MVVSQHINSLNRSLPGVSALALSLLAAVASLPQSSDAQGTHLWTQSQLEEFEKGTSRGVAIESDGHLRQGPGLKELLTTPSTFVWSVAADRKGISYAGTGSPATVLRVGSDGKPFTLFETKDISVQVLRIGPDGALYAATLPSGKVYKLNPASEAKQDEAGATVIFDASKVDLDGKTGDKPHYIWDLTFDARGRLYIATGGPGAVYRVDPDQPGAGPEEFFKSDEAHIRSLGWDQKGNLIAGSDGSGLVYRIDSQGKGYVLFEAPRREITSVTVGSDGTIFAACVGDKTRNTLPPLPVQGVGSVTITIVQPGSLQAVNSSTSVPEGTEIYALAEGQAPSKLWASKDDIVYALATQPNGLLALTGNRGHIYRIQTDGSYADVGRLEAQQGLSFASLVDGGMLIGSGNTGKLFEFGTAEKHEYASDVLDAGALARFGRVEVQPGSQGYELFTRSGNVEQPARGWSDWEPLKDGTTASPPGRFLEWRAVLHDGGTVGSVAVNYLPVNAAPAVDEVVVATGARLNPQNQPFNQQSTVNITFPSSTQSVNFDSGSNPGTPLQALKDRTSTTVRWAAHDDNGDDLVYSLYLRGDGETVWRLLKDKINEKAYSFDSIQIPDGGYQIKVVASDSPSHSPGDALSGEKISERFVIDTTPPVITDLRAVKRIECGGAPCASGLMVTFDAQDDASPIARAEYSLDAGPWIYVEPVGRISDSKREHYEVQIPVADLKAEHLVTVRAYDRYDNVGVAKAVFAAQAQ